MTEWQGDRVSDRGHLAMHLIVSPATLVYAAIFLVICALPNLLAVTEITLPRELRLVSDIATTNVAEHQTSQYQGIAP